MLFICSKKTDLKKLYYLNFFAIGAGMIFIEFSPESLILVQNQIIKQFRSLGLCESEGKCLKRKK